MEESTTLYRFFDKDDRLLYVGISKNYFSRLINHIQNKDWISQAVRCDLQHFDTREDASNAEIDAVQFENPVYNKQYASEREKHLADMIRHLTGNDEIQFDELHQVMLDGIKKRDEFLGVEWSNEIIGWNFVIFDYLASTFDDDSDYHSIPCKLCARNYEQPNYRMEQGWIELEQWPHFYRLIQQHFEETGIWLGKRERK